MFEARQGVARSTSLTQRGYMAINNLQVNKDTNPCISNQAGIDHFMENQYEFPASQ
jgi:hypothetical protein